MRGVLAQKIHHRVKNNLQVISSLLRLQASNSPSPEAVRLFHESENRIQSMALIHEQLYQSKNLSSINYPAYIHQLTSHLTQAYDPISRRVPRSVTV